MGKTDFNFGKGRYVFDRAKNYIQSVLYFVQFGMQVATVVKLYAIGETTLALGLGATVICVAGFVWFMRFDIRENLPAEHGWVWRINPAYQELLTRLDEIKNKMPTVILQDAVKCPQCGDYHKNKPNNYCAICESQAYRMEWAGFLSDEGKFYQNRQAYHEGREAKRGEHFPKSERRS